MDSLKKYEIYKFRNLVTQEEFKDYQKNVGLLNRLEKRILEVDELIYGDTGIINILAEVNGYSSHFWKFVISIEDKTITFNKLRFRESTSVYSEEYNLSDIGLDHEEIIYTIRKLSKLKNDTIEKEILKYISKKEKGLNNVNDLKDIPEHVYLNYVLCDKKIKNIKYRKYELDFFFELLLNYIDIIDIALIDVGFEELKKKKGEYISNIERISSKIAGKYSLPSNSELIKEVKQDTSLKTNNTIDNIVGIITTIDEQLTDVTCKLQSHPEYISLKSEYSELLTKVSTFEKKFLL